MIKYISVIAIFLFLISCKKEKTNQTNTGGGGSLYNGGTSTTGYPYNADAILILTSGYDYYDGIKYPLEYSLYGYFYESPNDTSTLRSIGNLTFDGTIIPYNTSSKNYIYYNYPWLGNSSYTWAANDTGSFGNFSATHNYNLPNIYNLNLDPIDTIYKSAGLTLTHINYAVDSISYYLNDAIGNQIMKKQAGNSTSVNFTPAELNQMDTSYIATFFVVLEKLRADTVGSKKVYFLNLSTINGAGKILP